MAQVWWFQVDPNAATVAPSTPAAGSTYSLQLLQLFDLEFVLHLFYDYIANKIFPVFIKCSWNGPARNDTMMTTNWKETAYLYNVQSKLFLIERILFFLLQLIFIARTLKHTSTRQRFAMGGTIAGTTPAKVKVLDAQVRNLHLKCTQFYAKFCLTQVQVLGAKFFMSHYLWVQKLQTNSFA